MYAVRFRVGVRDKVRFSITVTLAVMVRAFMRCGMKTKEAPYSRRRRPGRRHPRR